jgi:hypothetical protein
MADNRIVVPYSPYLSLKFNCHINVEIVQSIRSIKYLFKYTHKGPDKANIKLFVEKETPDEKKEKDEIKEHVSCRYVSPCEAIWRIQENRMHRKSHTVQRLSIHLPDQQSVCFADNATREEIEEAMKNDSHLVAWFKLNKQSEERLGKRVKVITGTAEEESSCTEENDIEDGGNENKDQETGPDIDIDFDSRQLLFTEIPRFYRFVKHQWIRRKRRSNCLARMYTVNPTGGDKERFYLRLILLHKRGAIGEFQSSIIYFYQNVPFLLQIFLQVLTICLRSRTE